MTFRRNILFVVIPLREWNKIKSLIPFNEDQNKPVCQILIVQIEKLKRFIKMFVSNNKTVKFL